MKRRFGLVLTFSLTLITGTFGAVVSIVICSHTDGEEVFPASSVAVTVNV